MEIKWLPNKSSKPSQIYSTGLEFCFVNSKNEQCHEFVYCKDFLQDAIHGFLNNKIASIYSFSYDPNSMPSLLLAKTKIALCNAQDKNFLSKIENVLDFLHQIETHLKLKKTKAITCSNPPKSYKSGVFIVRGSSRWQEAPPMLSLYTLLLRAGFTHKKGENYTKTIEDLVTGKTKPYQSNDADYLAQGKKGIDKILEKGYRKLFYSDIKRNYPANVPIGTLHNSFGIVGFSSNQPKKLVPGWYKNKKKKEIVAETIKSAIIAQTAEEAAKQAMQPIDCV